MLNRNTRFRVGPGWWLAVGFLVVGVADVNTATAADLSSVLGLSPKAAEGVVAYRAAHGRFEDAEALLKVPGIERGRIEEQPEALKFD